MALSQAAISRSCRTPCPHSRRGTSVVCSAAEGVDRRTVLAVLAVTGAGIAASDAALALPRGGIDARVASAFNNAFAAGGDMVAADKAWTEAIALDPSSASAWSNRGTLRLQFGRWQEARADLLHAVELEASTGGPASGLTLNQLGNADGAVGEWESACERYQQAAAVSPEIESLALANLALSFCQLERDGEAVQTARSVLRKDPGFLDMQCALTAFQWAQGNESAAEEEWSKLQNAQDGVGGMLYSRLSAVSRVKGRWPPRATAALDAFLGVSRSGVALGYDGKMRQYDFFARPKDPAVPQA